MELAQREDIHFTKIVVYKFIWHQSRPQHFFLPCRLGLDNTLTAPLQRSKTPNECPVYDTKQSDGQVQVLLGLWGIRSTSSLPWLPGLLWSGGGSNR